MTVKHSLIFILFSCLFFVGCLQTTQTNTVLETNWVDPGYDPSGTVEKFLYSGDVVEWTHVFDAEDASVETLFDALPNDIPSENLSELVFETALEQKSDYMSFHPSPSESGFRTYLKGVLYEAATVKHYGK